MRNNCREIYFPTGLKAKKKVRQHNELQCFLTHKKNKKIMQSIEIQKWLGGIYSPKPKARKKAKQ